MIPRHITTKCPHCGAACKAVRTLQVTPTYREVTFLCSNDDCGYRFVAAITPVRTLQPSMHPDPEVHIPQSVRPSPAPLDFGSVL